MKEQLKPCPFCGSDNLQSREGLEWSDVRCKACLQSVSSFPCSAENIWNKRPIEDALQAEIETLTGKLESAKYSDAQFREKAKLLQVELDQLRKDNQALVEQINQIAKR